MWCLRWILVAGSLALVGLGLSSAATAAEQQSKGQEQWRYVLHNSEWWYWLPESRWVYWRENRWNPYDPKTFVLPSPVAAAPAGQVGVPVGRQAPASDARPFYGHALSDRDLQPSAGSNEVGPFYGHALPSDVMGRWGWRRDSIRPFYGHAVSPDGSP